MTTAKKPDPWFVRKLIALGACDEAIKYARKYRTFPAAWRECDDRLWRLWLTRELNLRPYGTSLWLSDAQFCRRFPADRVAEKLRQVK